MTHLKRYIPSICRGSRWGSQGSSFNNIKSFQFSSQVRREGMQHLEIIFCTCVIEVCHGSSREITVIAINLRNQIQLWQFGKLGQIIPGKKTLPEFSDLFATSI